MISRTSLPLLFLGLVVSLTGCATAPMIGPSQPVRVVVLDAQLPPQHLETSTEIIGWWFTARDLHRDANDGLHWSSHLAQSIEHTIPNVQVHPQMDLRTFMAVRAKRIQEAHPELTDPEIQELLLEQSPVDYGRTLNADFVVTGRIYDSYLSHHRTFHWWTAVVSVEVEVWDVSQEKRIWVWMGNDTDKINSPFGLMKDLSRKCARNLGRYGVFSSIEPVASRTPSE